MSTATMKTRKTLAAALTALVFLGAATGDEKRLSIYSSVATYSLPVIDRAGHEYVGLLEVLEPLGRVSAAMEGQHWKLRYNNVDSDFVPGRTRARIRGRDVDLPVPFVMESSRGLVAVSSLGNLLPRFLGNPVNFHEPARRLFIGDVATQVAAQLDASNPPRLVLNFTAPVNPTISTEPGRLRMVFTREPVVPPGSETLSFDNRVITETKFSESNGSAEMTIAANAPLMANFSNGGRTITVTAASQGGATNPPAPSTATGTGAEMPAPAPPAIGGTAGGTAEQPNIPTTISNARRLLAVVDPAHGGSERGAALTDTLAEKTVTLGFARLLRHELEQRGFSVLLLRDADDTLTLDQRAGTANAAHPAIYVSLHAASQGTGVRIYTALLPPEGASKGPFHAWNAAQATLLGVSQKMSSALLTEMQKQQIPARGYSASLRPLNSLLIPAVAVELAPGSNGVADLASANYQQRAAAAIADAAASVRDRMGAQP